MEVIGKRKARCTVEDLSVDDVVVIVKGEGFDEFEQFVRDKELDGKKILNVTEGIVKLWKAKANAKSFIKFVEDLKINPEKYVTCDNDKAKHSIKNKEKTVIKVKQNETITVENNGKRVSVTNIREENFSTTSVGAAEDILNKIVPAKSFLYSNQSRKLERINNSYLPMNIGTPLKKSKSKFFRLSSYEYPLFDLSRFKYFTSNRNELFNDRGYYCIKNQQNGRSVDDIYRSPEPRTRHRSQCSSEDMIEVNNDRIYLDDHFYEDLCYNDVANEDGVRNRVNSSPSNTNAALKSLRLFKIQEIFHSFRLPTFFKTNVKDIENDKKFKDNVEDKVSVNIESNGDMYDSVHINTNVEEKSVSNTPTTVSVEEYLVPIQTTNDYCDVMFKEKEETFVGMLMKMFENKFGGRRETHDVDQSEPRSAPKISEPIQKWNDGERKPGERRSNMADRPLPVPVESEAYFMDVDRGEAFRLLQGQQDGTFLLRPSSQPTHAYTLSVCCGGQVHNVGVRRRADARLALGYARRGERTFDTVPALLRHHTRKKLLLVAGGITLGSTTLKDSPLYYQIPSNIPVEAGKAPD